MLKLKTNKTSGITLISLVVTIIVLLLLAGISIMMLSDNNGILTRAKQAKVDTQTYAVREYTEIIRAEYLVENNGQQPTSRYIIEKLIEQRNITQEQVENYGDETCIGIINVNGTRIEIPGRDPVGEDIYVALYNNGILVFSNNEEEIDSNLVVKSYGNITNLSGYNNPEWYGNPDINKVKILNRIKPQSMYAWFSGLLSLTEIENIELIDTRNVTNMSSLFNTCISLTNIDVSTFDTRNVTDMSNMFYTWEDVQSQTESIIGLDKLDTSKVQNMSYMFAHLNVTELDVSHFDTSSVRDFNHMFFDCENLAELDTSKFVTQNAINLSDMFNSCSLLRSINVTNFNTSNVETIAGMFGGCISLASINITRFNTTNVTDMSRLFSQCYSLTNIDISNLDMSNVEHVTGMFYGCGRLTKIVYPDTAKKIESNTFAYCTSLETLYIPASVTTITACSSSSSLAAHSYPFYGTNNSAVIYCEATSIPSGWGTYWYSYGYRELLVVKLGYTYAQYEAEINE